MDRKTDTDCLVYVMQYEKPAFPKKSTIFKLHHSTEIY